MNIEEFRDHAHELVDWMADYLSEIEKYPVKSQSKPGEIKSSLPDQPPMAGEDFSIIFQDFQNKIMPGITHWQSPNFFSYFPANSSYPSVLGEMLTASLGVQGMIWETSPAAAELEEIVLNWLKQMCGLPDNFHGVIQDTASTSSLVALLSAREKITNYGINENGFSDQKFRIYCSTEAHSSIEKAVKIAGYGKKSLVKLAVDENLALDPVKLEKQIIDDLSNDYIPVCVVSALGTTGTAAIDPIYEIAEICKKYNIWHHIDAAYAGSALVLEKYRPLIKGIESADSYVFNPHKWMFTNFDCSAYFVKDKEALIRSFEILPEYLKTNQDSQVNNYRDWGIQLGRRFRSLKLWFVLRSFGVDGIKEKISDHILWANWLAGELDQHKNFQLHKPQNFALVCFRLNPEAFSNQKLRNDLSKKLLDRINSGGKIYMSHTKVNGEFTFRLVAGQTYLTKNHIEKAWKLIREQTEKMIYEFK